MKHTRLERSDYGPHAAQALSPRRAVYMALLPGERLDLDQTLRSGQVFRWRKHGDTWYGPHGSGSLAVRTSPEGLEVRGQGAALTAEDAWRFLGLDRPLGEIERRLQHDRWVARSMAAYPGLRLLRQDPWECLINFLCSQLSNIPKIKLSTERLARRWGTVHGWENGIDVAVMPPPAVLAALPETALRECALGYRAAYLRDTAAAVVVGKIDLERLRAQPYADALAALLRLPGVGRKVADCVLLFALDQPAAFPVDVWVRRAMREWYPRGLRAYLPDWDAREAQTLSRREHDAIVQFAWDRWGALAGYAQQYLFHARRLGLPGKDAE